MDMHINETGKNNCVMNFNTNSIRRAGNTISDRNNSAVCNKNICQTERAVFPYLGMLETNPHN